MSLGYRLTVRVSSLFWNLIYDVLRGRRFAFIESGADSLKFLCCVPLVSEDVSSEMPSDSIRFVDVATFRAPRLGGVIILGSFQSLRAGRCRAFSVSLICPEARACRRHILCRLAKPPVSRSLFVWQNDRHHASRFAFLSCAHPWAPHSDIPTFRHSDILAFWLSRLSRLSALSYPSAPSQSTSCAPWLTIHGRCHPAFRNYGPPAFPPFRPPSARSGPFPSL